MKSTQNSNFVHGILNGLAQLHQGNVDQVHLVQLEYLYYTDLDLKGEALAEDLKKLNYEAEVDATHRRCDCTRVFGKTTLLSSREDDLKKWYLEMRDIGNYHGCDFICYGIPHNPVKSLNETVSSRPVADVQESQGPSQSPQHGMEIFRDLYHLHGGGSDFMRFDYWFYTDEMAKAESLADELRKLFYEVDVRATGMGDDRICVSGRTAFMNDEEGAMESWVKKMNELASVHDCSFDGWGSAVEDETWVGHDTPEYVVHDKLGLWADENLQ